jgi:formylglycine-generating enzyme required for sulfatase activity
MKKNRMFLASVLTLAALMFAACPSPTDDDSGDGPMVTGVTISPPTASVNKGGTETFTATVEGTGNPTQTVSWTVEGGGAETAISPAGVLTVDVNETALSLTVRATSTVDNTKSGTAVVTVSTDTATVNTVTVNPSSASVAKGGTGTFTATVAGDGSPAQTVSWGLSGNTSTETTISGGVLTVAAGETATSLTVTATSTVDPGKSGTAMVTVLPPITASYTEMVLATPNANDSVTIIGNSAYYYSSSNYYYGPSDYQYKGVFIQDRTVILSPFYIAKYETTYGLWYEVYQWATSTDRGANKYTFANKGREGHNGTDGEAPTTVAKNEPVTYINWRDAVVWCNAYSEMSGKEPVYRDGSNTVLRNSNNSVEYSVDITKGEGKNGYRLPTEAEWEYATRGGGASPFDESFAYKWAGTNVENNLKDYAWYSSNSSGTHLVGEKTANGLGLYDMSGNVWELCWDWCRPVDIGLITDPRGASVGVYRVARGGGCSGGASDCAVAPRANVPPDYRTHNTGFRLALCP